MSGAWLEQRNHVSSARDELEQKADELPARITTWPIDMNLEALEVRLSLRELAPGSASHDVATHARRPVLIEPPTQSTS